MLLLAVLVSTLGWPVLHGWAQGLVRLLISLLFGYTLFMATVWNRIERAGIVAGKSGGRKEVVGRDAEYLSGGRAF